MPNISADVLRAQCAELRQQLQGLGVDRDRWRDQAKAIVTMLPERLEHARQGGKQEAFLSLLKWCQRHNVDTVPARIHRELVGLGARLATSAGECKWCDNRGYIQAICPACRCGLPEEEGT